MDLNTLRGSGVAGPQVGTGAGLPTRFGTINTDYAAGTALPKTIAKSQNSPFAQLANWQGSQQALFNEAKNLGTDTFGAMYNLDQATVLPEDAAYNITTVLKYLIAQMNVGGISTPTAGLQVCTAAMGAQTGLGTPAGTPQFVSSVLNVQGLKLQLMFPETITFQCTQDAQGGATLGNETISIAGEAGITDPSSHLYPGGSAGMGGNISSMTLCNAEKDNDGNNLLQNGGFNKFTSANSPDNWVTSVGAVGAQVLDGGSGNVYTTGNTHVLEFAGDGATSTAVNQSFNTAPNSGLGLGGTSYKLVPDAQYCVSFWVKVAGGAPAAGVLELALIDGANNVLADDNGVSNLKTFDLTAGGLNIGATYTFVSAVFRTPANLLTQTTPFKLRFRQSTPLTNAKNAFIARMAMNLMRPLYNGGPFLSMFSSNVAPVNGILLDQWTMAVSNNYNTSGNGLFHQWLDRLLQLRSLGLQFPYKAASVLDSLIQ